MARIRTIKPDFWTSEQIVECSPTARLLFVGLWNFADDGGVHPYSTKRLKMEVFPGDEFTDAEVQSLVDELLRTKLLRSFTVAGERFLYVTGWRHQKIEKPSFRWPQPNDQTEFDDGSTNGRRTIDDSSTTAHPRNGMEGKGREEEEEVLSLHSLSETIPSPELRQAFTDWAAYKAESGSKYKPRALKALATRMQNRAKAHGIDAVVNAVERAISQLYKGWEFNEWFDGKTPSGSRVVTAEEFANMDVDLMTGATR